MPIFNDITYNDWPDLADQLPMSHYWWRKEVKATPRVVKPRRVIIKVVKKKRTPSEIFVSSHEWKVLREQAYMLYGRICLKCGSSNNITMDHIKPKSKYPALALDIDNLQPLCWPCNKKKSYTDETNYRINISICCG